MSLEKSIKELRGQGYTYKQIEKELGCSRSTISYHLGNGQKEKSANRKRKWFKNNRLFKKIENFHKITKKIEIPPSTRPLNHRISSKISQYHSNGKRMNTAYSQRTFTVKEATRLIKERGVCYLTGDPIDIEDTQSYHFDHIKPRVNGGENNLDNLGITTKEANYAKRDMEFEDFIKMCHKIVERYPDLDNLEPKHTRG